ncbi:MAG: formylglycine-generating enzyme family protein, partial [Leptospirales bacterium]|nr:formylglycine-generating enzyme family protein [Leptospirales bacterium]
MKRILFPLLLVFCLSQVGVSGRDRSERRPGKFVQRGVVESVQPEKQALCAQASEVPSLRRADEAQVRAFFFEKENDMILMSPDGEEVGTFKIDRVAVNGMTTLCGSFELSEPHIVSPGDRVGVELSPTVYKPQSTTGPAPVLPPARVRNEVDKKIMLRVEWDFLVYGQGEDPAADNYNLHFFDRSPQVTPRIETFYMDQYEVTNREYLFFCKRAGHALPEEWRLTGQYPEGTADHPFVLASFEDAQQYARWTGKRLPTEFEWELGARGGLKLLRNGSGREGIKRSPPVYPM